MSGDIERLTRRELQVAVLVAGGMTDREVARRLSITTRTAEWHVQQILTKLGLKSRTELAVLVARAEALGGPLLAADRRNRELPAVAAAFLGYKAEATQEHEVLETTRLLREPLSDTDSEREERLLSVAEAGYNPVVVRVIYLQALDRVAKQFRNTEFAIVDDATLCGGNPNVTGIVFADHEGAYLVGSIAAQASRTGIIGFVGGVHVSLIEKIHAGFLAGAKTIAPDIQIVSRYLTDPPNYSGFALPGRAKTVAGVLYREGADVVFHAAASSGTGVFEAAKQAGALAIGIDSDQYLNARPDVRACILTSLLKRVDAAVASYLSAVSRKLPHPHVMTFDLANAGVGYSKSNPLVQEYVAKTDDLRRRIVAGEIKVPDRP